MIVTLLRRSKGNHYITYFEKYSSDIKKTWDGIRQVLNVKKKKTTSIDRLIYKNKTFTSDIDKANSLNDFFVNIGSTVEAKIPQTKIHYSSYMKSPNDKSIFLQRV